MKVCIIGLDGLEASYIERFNFPNLRQVEYGRVRVPITDVGEPQTSIVWSCFLTGKLPHEHGVTKPAEWNFKPLNWLYRYVEGVGMRRFLLHHELFGGFMRNVLSVFGVKQSSPKLRHPTFLDAVPNSVGFSIPCLDEDVIQDSKGLIDAILKHESREKFLHDAFNRFVNEQKTFWRLLHSNPPLLFVHFQITDLYGHIYCREPDKLLNLYRLMDDFVLKVKKRIPSNCLLLIISDHGITDNHGHSNYGFYSSNHPLNLHTPHITDFYKIIIEWCKR